MKGLEKIRQQIADLRDSIPEPEPWPPTEEGDLLTILYQQLQAEGVELPIEHPGGDALIFLLELDAPRVWADYEGDYPCVES